MKNHILVITVLLLLSPTWHESKLVLGDEVTIAQMQAVHTAYTKAKSEGFSVESMVSIYRLENSAAAVKKLVDSAQSNPQLSISQADSLAMETTRDRMNQMVLDHLASVTGGTVEVINFGKQNGIRSDKDQTIYAVDGKRLYDATEMKVAYEEHFQKTFGIDMERMDMSMFDGDASIPDWRNADITFEEFVTRYEKGQAKLEQNPEAYQEAGTFRAQVDGRTASQGRVRVTKKNPQTGEIEVIHGTAAEISTRYGEWTADVPYRNAMDSSVENKGRFDHASDFIDKMKYFNRTIGNGLNALALENWNVDYIFHLKDLKTAKERSDFIRQMVDDTYQIDASNGQRETFAKVIDIAAQIELDKMNSSTKNEEHYLQSLITVEKKNAASRGETVDDAELLSRARGKFYSLQSQIMDRNIVATARQKMLTDFDPEHLKKIANKYGAEEAKKLRWETARQIQRAFEKLDDPKLANKLVAEAPEHLRSEIEELRQLAKIKNLGKRNRKKKPIKVRKSDATKARTQGPEQQVISKKASSFTERRQQEVDELLSKMKTRYDDFESTLRSGQYSDEAVTEKMRNRVLESLGFEERATFVQMEVEYRRQFSGSKLFRNVVNLGNVNSVISCIQIYQQTGDMTQVAKTALWELVSNVPGVAQFATLKQSFNDGNYQSLSWLFIAWQLPAAGQVKMVFDVAANTMRIVYDHAMTPLANDRFSMVYMGYVDKQPAGWSPLTPGWKNRRQAVSQSILQFVPGETFAEKRTNMYKFFQARLDKKLRKNGLDPTTTEYWQRRDQVLDAFFGSYVKMYFAAENDFFGNTTVGLRAIAELPKLKRRLIQTLKNDFMQGEMNDRLAEVALEDMNEAIAKIAEQQRESIRVERQVLQTGDFITQKLQDRMRDAFASLTKEEPAESKPRIAVEIYPSTVLEGQEARIAVRAISANDKQGGEGHKIEIRRLRPEAVLSGDGDGSVAERLGATIDASDQPFVAKLKNSATDDTEVFVTKYKYEVTVRNRSGEVLKTETVSLNLAATSAAPPAEGSEPHVVIRVDTPDSKTQRLSRRYIRTWEKPSAENCTQALIDNYSSEIRRTPFVRLRWPDMPKKKFYGARIKITGAIPYLEQAYFDTCFPLASFPSNQKKKLPRGNAFSIHLRTKLKGKHRVGEFKIAGELLAFEKRTSASRMATATPLARYPFTASLRISDAPYEATGTAHLGRFGWCSGSIRMRWRQRGRRIAQITGGGSTYFGMFDGSMSFGLPKATSVPQSVQVSFWDYGKQVTVQVPIETRPASKRLAKDASRLPEALKKIADLQSRSRGIDYFAYQIANTYAVCSSYFNISGQSSTDLSQLRKYLDSEIDTLRRVLARTNDATWRGWGPTNFNYKGISIHGLKKSEKALGLAHVKNLIHARIAWRQAEMARIYIAHWQAEEAKRYLLACGAELDKFGMDPKAGLGPRQSLASVYTRYANLIFHTTGDLNSARAEYQLGRVFQRQYKQLSGQKFVDRPYSIKLDQEFESSQAR